MGKFRYYLINVAEGEITGTDDSDVALEMAHSPDDFVIDTSTNEWLHDKEREEILQFSLEAKEEDAE